MSIENLMGGMAVLEVESRDEADEIVQNDPAVRDGFYVIALHPWRIARNCWGQEAGCAIER